jgi:hypothetical protein
MVPAGQKKKWDKFEMDGVTGVTPHVCHKQQQQQQPLTQQQPSTNSNNNSNLSEEIAAIKAQLLGLVSRLDNIEQELQIAVN